MSKNRQTDSRRGIKNNRVRRKPKKEHIRFWTRRVLLTVEIAVVCGLVVTIGLDLRRFILSSGWFAITDIDVRGTETIARRDIIAGSRIALGQSALTVDLAQSAASLEAMARVKTARIERHFPNRVTITVTERQPMALLMGDSLYEMDSEGMIVAKAGERSASMPVISGLAERNVFAGHKMNDDLIEEAIQLMTAFYANALNKRLRISEIDISDAENLTVLLADPPAEIHCGRGGYSDKFRKLEMVMGDLEAREHPLDKLEYMDMRFGDIIPLKFREQ